MSRYSTSVTNSSGVAQIGTFNFNVDYGQIGIFGSGTNGLADLLLQIRVDGQTKAQDRTTISLDGTGTHCVDADLPGALNNYMKCASGTSSSASSNGGLYSFDFNLAVGQTLNLEYDIIATVSGTAMIGSATDCVFQGYGDAVGINALGIVEGGGNVEERGAPSFQCTNFNAIARSGDPPSANFSTLDASITTANAVPEPGSLGLVALAFGGVGGLAAARRRRREKQE